jgi:hypothetical protein
MGSIMWSILISYCHGAGKEGMATLQQHGKDDLFPSWCKTRRKVAEHIKVSTISFIQANLQHSIAASRVLTRTVVVKGIDMVLIQETWYRDGRIMGLNIQAIPFSVRVEQLDLQHVSLRGT